MENASKALLISGSILIAMLIISIGVYLFSNYSDLGNSHNQRMQATEIQKFNSNFTKFEGREDITVQEIVSVVNFVKEYEEETEIKVTVNTPLGNDLSEKSNEYLVELIQNNSINKSNGAINYYKCERITMNGPYGTVDSIQFK
ncbi:MAG: hypothetical protein IJE59_04885 [Clostridia bacterium]|nr:hypothetical protein [Clostridia bacterium]